MTFSLQILTCFLVLSFFCVMLAWLGTRSRMPGLGFAAFLRFSWIYFMDRWERKPDLWSTLSYFLRFIDVIWRRFLIIFQTLLFENKLRRQLKMVWKMTGASALPHFEHFLDEHRFGFAGLVRVGPPDGTPPCPALRYVCLDPEEVIRNGLDHQLAIQNLKPWEHNFLWLDRPDVRFLKDSSETLRHIDIVFINNIDGEYDEIRSVLTPHGFAELEPQTQSSKPPCICFYQKNVLTMSLLGASGQFGNQFLQYFFLKTHARENYERIQTSSWIGQLLFDLPDPPIKKVLRQVGKHGDSRLSDQEFPLINVNFVGYCLCHTRRYAPHREFLQSILKPRPEIEKIISKGVRQLKHVGNTIVALHLRYSTWDCGRNTYFIAPCEWYLEWLEKLWPTLDKPVLFIATDVPKNTLHHFDSYDPYTSKRLGLRLLQASFYPDYYLLTQADALAVSNSSFSFTAAMLNQHAKIFMRPDNELKKLIPFDPWDAEPILEQYTKWRSAEWVG